MNEIGFISLFSGAGGLDLGLEGAGLTCRYAADIDPAAHATLLANQRARAGHLQHAVITRADVSQTTGGDILGAIGAARGTVPLLAGGPPCQSWSSAGHQQGWLDPRGRLFDDFVRLADELDVRWLLFENVRGLLTARGPDGVPGSALTLIRSKLLRAGFQTQVTLLNAADFGVPQRRVRLVVFGYRTGDRLALPSPTHAKGDASRPWVAMSAALSAITVAPDEIIRPNERLLDQLAALKPGSGVKSPGKAETTRPGGHWGYKQGAFIADTRLAARTVTASQQQDWVIDPHHGIRRLTPRECAAIQSFPRDWVFAGTRADQYRLIGNAVPPLLAARIGVALREHIGRSWHDRCVVPAALDPLGPDLQAAISYTAREEWRNGPSRRAAPDRRQRVVGGGAVAGR